MKSALKYYKNEFLNTYNDSLEEKMGFIDRSKYENKGTLKRILFLLAALVSQENYILFFDLRPDHLFGNRLLFYRGCQKTLYAIDLQNDPSSILRAQGQQ